jgi:putative drug exporter of the RND superfamily
MLTGANIDGKLTATKFTPLTLMGVALMLGRMGAFVVRHAKAVLALTLVALAGGGLFGVGAFGKLSAGGFQDPNAESTQAGQLIESAFGEQTDLVFLVEAKSGTVDDPSVAATGRGVAESLAAEPELSGVTSYWTTNAPSLRSADGRYALVLAHAGDEDLVAGLAERHARDDAEVAVRIGGSAAVGADVGDHVGRDLALAESIAVPLILVLLVFAFRSVVAALLPLAIGGIAILGTFAELSVFGSVTDVSIYAVNLTTALGLGLAIDYALLIVSRFREELARGLDTGPAVVRTVETAGRTVLFSAATVAAALAVLALFPLYFLRSFAYAGVGVVVIAAAGAVVVLPALLTVLGGRINAGRLPWPKGAPTTASPFWGRLAGAVMRRPALTALPVIAVLLLAATPLLRVGFGTPDDRVLPATATSRQVGDVLRAEFTANSTAVIQLVSTGPVDPAELARYAGRLSELPGVRQVHSGAGVFADGSLAGRTPSDATFAGQNAQRLSVDLSVDPRSGEAEDLVREVRATPEPAGATMLAGGYTASLVDSKAAIGSRLPLAIALVLLTTFLVLFLFTGSVVQPVRSLLLNALSLSATVGVMVFMFQQGNLASLLGFTPMPLDTSMLILLFCVAFGLSMDYEVFVLSRIKELHDAGAGNRVAVTEGLARTGRIVSTAAALLAVTFFAFGTASVSFLQMFGIGSGLAVLIDATLVRGVLVPAWMRVVGPASWWAPRPLRWLHGRVGLTESPAPAMPSPRPATAGSGSSS